jgi:hypothetical protein
MQLSTGMPAIRRFLICAFLAVSSGCASAAEGGNDLETVVKNLYAQRKNDAPVQEASIAVLEKYFRPELARALVHDRQCAEASKEICRIDFDVLFDSQDPDYEASLAIERTSSSRRVQVCLGSPALDRRCISYLGRSSAGRVRITDIVYASGSSLRAILGLFPLEDAKENTAQ